METFGQPIERRKWTLQPRSLGGAFSKPARRVSKSYSNPDEDSSDDELDVKENIHPSMPQKCEPSHSKEKNLTSLPPVSAPVVSAKKSTSESSKQPNRATTTTTTHVSFSPSVTATIAKLGNPKPGERIVVGGVAYTILKFIGGGGSSQVHMVMGGKDIFAMKIVDLRKENGLGVSFETEVKCLQALRHSRHCVRMISSEVKFVPGNSDTESLIPVVLYLVLELADRDFHSLMVQERKRCTPQGSSMPLPDSEYWGFVRYHWERMLLAVKDVHDAGYVHADLKPANFMISKGLLKVIDFGISVKLEKVDSDNDDDDDLMKHNAPEVTSIVRPDCVGTVSYMGPELFPSSATATAGGGGVEDESSSTIDGSRISPESDVWALGCILYQMVFGIAPFSTSLKNPSKEQPPGAAKNLFYVVQGIKDPEKRFEHGWPSLYDEDLLHTIQACLQKDRKARPGVVSLLRHKYVKGNQGIEYEHNSWLR